MQCIGKTPFGIDREKVKEEARFDGKGESNVGERAAGVDSDLAGVGANLTDEEVGGIFVES